MNERAAVEFNPAGGTMTTPQDPLGRTFDEYRAWASRSTSSDNVGLSARYRRLMLTGEDGGAERATVSPPARCERDGEVVKFVLRLPEGLETESVIVPMWRGGSRWTSLCVSSQVGCAMGCTFCETAQMGLLRNLSPGQIVGQVVAARRYFSAPVRNVVFMGMGEPMDNFDNVAQAIRVLTDRRGLSLGMGRITLSTVGRTAGIRRLAALGWRRINLAVSLNAPNDEIRSRIMPINRAEPMAELRRALQEYPLRRCQFLMIEYVLIPGINDAREHAREVAAFLRGIPCCVNVIPYNPRRESPWPAPDAAAVSSFLGWLRDEGQFSKLRLTKGRASMAACGQLGNRALARRGTSGHVPCGRGVTVAPARIPPSMVNSAPVA
jgi:23S rRNA (adenine2503-C2)-methyltransferase